MSDGGKQVIWVTSKDADEKTMKENVKEEEELNDEDSIEEILDDDMEDGGRETNDGSALGTNEEPSSYILTQARFQCSMCHFVASCHQAYTDHMNIHTGIKPYCCQYCPFSSAFRSSLLRHVKIHTNANEKPFRCARCSYESRYKWNVTVHMRKCHKDFSDCRVSVPPKSSPSSQPLPKIGSVFSVNPPISQSSEASSEMSSSPEPMYASVNTNSSVDDREENRQKQTSIVLHSPPSTEQQVFQFTNSVTSPKQTEFAADKYYPVPNDSFLPKTAAALKLLPSMTKSFGIPQIRSVPYTITAPLAHNMNVNQMPTSAPHATEISPVMISAAARDSKAYSENRHSQENQVLQNDRNCEENRSQGNASSPGSPPQVQQETPKVTYKTEATQTTGENNPACSRCELLTNNLKSCPHCGTLFSDNVIYTLHMSCHGNHHPFQCAICGYECRDKIEFTCHITRSQHKN